MVFSKHVSLLFQMIITPDKYIQYNYISTSSVKNMMSSAVALEIFFIINIGSISSENTAGVGKKWQNGTFLCKLSNILTMH